MPSKNKRDRQFRPFQPYECPFEKDLHIRKTHFLLRHPNYLALSSSAKVLYDYMLDWARGKEEFTFSASMAQDLMARGTYIKSRDELIKYGFIVYMNRHRNARDAEHKREAAEFKFSSAWIQQTNPQLSVKEYFSTYRRRL